MDWHALALRIRARGEHAYVVNDFAPYYRCDIIAGRILTAYVSDWNERNV